MISCYITGPTVGDVTSSSFEVIIPEITSASSYILNLIPPDGSQESVTLTPDQVMDGILLYTFDNLKSETEYQVDVAIVDANDVTLDVGSVMAQTPG